MIPFLRSGDEIALIATAKKITLEEIQSGISFFEKQNWKVLKGKNLFSEHHQFAGRDIDRIHDLQWAIDHPSVKAIFIARGGYGTLRLIDHLDFSALEKNPKWIIGYSDITALLNHTLAQFNLPGLHASMPINYTQNTPEALNSLIEAITKHELNYQLTPHELQKNGRAKGQLFGGNLSLLTAMQGSNSMPDPNGKILFLEDLDEYLYHIDRMILALKRSGIFSKINGLVIGSFTDMKDNPVPFGKNAYEIISEHCAEYSFPIIFNFPAGHQNDNRSLIIGGETEIIATENHVQLLQSIQKK